MYQKQKKMTEIEFSEGRKRKESSGNIHRNKQFRRYSGCDFFADLFQFKNYPEKNIFNENNLLAVVITV